MDLDAILFYLNSRPYELVSFDLRCPGTAASFHDQRAVWGPDSDVELLDDDHAVLIVRPGGALEIAA